MKISKKSYTLSQAEIENAIDTFIRDLVGDSLNSLPVYSWEILESSQISVKATYKERETK